jgi:hypothetical protein
VLLIIVDHSAGGFRCVEDPIGLQTRSSPSPKVVLKFHPRRFRFNFMY